MQTIAWCLLPFVMMAVVMWIMFVLSFAQAAKETASALARQAQALEIIARHCENLGRNNGDSAGTPR